MKGREEKTIASYSVLPVKTQTKHFFTEGKATCCGGCTYNNFRKVFVNLLHKVQKVMNLRREDYGDHVNPRRQENVKIVHFFFIKNERKPIILYLSSVWSSIQGQNPILISILNVVLHLMFVIHFSVKSTIRHLRISYTEDSHINHF